MGGELILGIDGGATKTKWTLWEHSGSHLRPRAEGRLGPGSMKLLDRQQLRGLLEALPKDASHVGVFLAGCATEADRADLARMAAEVWPAARIKAGSDRESGFAAAFGKKDGVSVIAGTGSAVTGRKDGFEDRAGGWGHLLGDSGGGYDLAIHALRRVLFDFDTHRHISPLASDVLRTLALNNLRELTAWAQAAHKNDLARLTPLLFEHSGQPEVAEILKTGARDLAQLTASVVLRLGFEQPPIRLTGSVFLKQALYVELFTTELGKIIPHADVSVCEADACLGAALLVLDSGEPLKVEEREFHEPALHSAATEQTNPRSGDLDQLPTEELVTLFAREERFVEEALLKSAPDLVRAIDVVTQAMSRGGRLFYVGAGTSGRLGVLDASEMPPTFGVSPDQVQAIMAGGAVAIVQSVEGAEDDVSSGALAVEARGVRAGDVLCGIAASGRTPFVKGALDAARALGVPTILLSCNPARQKGVLRADVEIDLATGPELLTGSTRLKAGTATKVALNIISTCVMIRLGRVVGNFMSCMRPTNDKLRNRAIRIVAARCRLSENEAEHLLKCANWDISAALKSAPRHGQISSMS